MESFISVTASLFGEKKTSVFSMKRAHLFRSAGSRLGELTRSDSVILRICILNFLIEVVKSSPPGQD